MLYQQPEPPNKINAFMEKFGLSALLVVFTIIATIIGTVLLGKIQVLDFNWLMLILGLIMVAITISSVWYSLRTRKIFQNKYQEDIAALRNDNRAFKNEFRQYYKEEIERSHQFEINFSQAIAKEQKEQLEEVKRECMEAISDAKNAFDSGIKNTTNIFSGTVKSYEVAVDSYKDYLFQTMKRMDTLEERLRKEFLPESKE